MVAARIANMPNGGDREGQHRANLHSASSAADMLNVSERTVKAARAVQREAVPELIAAVETGAVAHSSRSSKVVLEAAGKFQMNDNLTNFLAVMWLVAFVVAVLWALLPFAVFGIKARLDKSIRLQEQLLTKLEQLVQAQSLPDAND